MFRRDHAKLIYDISEISGLFHDSSSLEDFLQKITNMVTKHMGCEVCSIYLYYEDQNELVLKATKGLNPESIGQVKMKSGEGLTGLAFKEKRLIYEGQAKNNPNFRFFSGIGEEQYESFIAAPILKGSMEIGVLVIQSIKKNYFSQEDQEIFKAITSQLANTLETARLLITLNRQKKKKVSTAPKDLKFVKGRSGSEGVVLASPIIIDALLSDLTTLANQSLDLTEKDFFKAVEQSKEQLELLQQQIEKDILDASGLIFTAQLLMLQDTSFIEAISALIKQGMSPGFAIVAVVEDYVKKFSALEDSYLRDKIYDVKDIGRRLLENITGKQDHHHDLKGHIVIASQLLPSDTVKLYSQEVKGIILLSGGVTSHVSILARSLNIPLVITDEIGFLSMGENHQVLLDAVMGYIYVDPSEDIIRQVMDRESLHENIEEYKKSIKDQARTKDGTPIKLMANINLLGDLKAAIEFKAQGIGLYRSEFPFLIRSSFPSEEEQFVIYKRLVEAMPGKEITLRTLDIGGDKVLSYFDYAHEENPFLGLRSIRFSLRHKDLFMVQLRAMLRASAFGNLRIMFPMISSVDEFQEAKGILQECIHELEKEKHKIAVPKIGTMVEMPSLIEIIDDIAQEADFLSVGTNDFVQYLLAVDRTNERVANLYLPHHPSVLRALNRVAEAAIKHQKEISVCGDMASNLKFLPFLLGIGIRTLSVDARYLPRLHEALNELTIEKSKVITAEALKQRTVERIADILKIA